MKVVKQMSYDLSPTTMVLQATETDSSWASTILEEKLISALDLYQPCGSFYH